MQQKFLLPCVLMFGATVFSQHSASGTISTQTGVPLPGAHLHIGARMVSSDQSGRYLVTDLPSGNTRIYISYIGYKPIDTTVVLSRDLTLDFTLRETISALEQVNVRQFGRHSRSLREEKLKTETIQKYASQTLGDALKEVPGVSTLKTGSTVVKPVINGLYGNRVAVINNNVRLEDQQWGTEHAPNFDINAAGRITVVKGAAGLQYGGDAVGGLVILDPVSIKTDTLTGRTIASYASNGRGGSFSSSLHKGNPIGWSWNLLGTVKYFGDRQAPDYVLSNTGNREANFSGDIRFAAPRYEAVLSYSYYNAQIGILSASHTGNVNDLFRSITDKTPFVVNDFTYGIGNPKQRVSHHLAKAAYTRHLGSDGSLSVQYAYQFNDRQEFDVRRANYSNLAALDLELETKSVHVDYKNRWNGWHIRVGTNGAYQYNFADSKTRVRPLIPTYEKYDAGFYGIATYDVSTSLSVEAGARYDFSQTDAIKFYQKSRWDERGYNARFANFIKGEYGSQWLTKPSFKYHNLSASAGLHKQFHHDWDAYVNVSLAARNPNPSELFSDGLHHATGIIELGDLRLKQERAVKFSATASKRWASVTVDVNPYVNWINDYMFLQPTGFETTIRGAFPVWAYQQTQARLTGIDFHSKWNVTKRWSHDLTAALVSGRDVTNHTYLIDMPPLALTNKIRYAREDWHALSVELQSEWVTRQSQYPDNNFQTNLIANGTLVPVVVDISTPPPAYHLLHLYAEAKFDTLARTQTVIAVSVQNLMNTTYRDYLNRQRFFADETGRNIQIQLKINY